MFVSLCSYSLAISFGAYPCVVFLSFDLSSIVTVSQSPALILYFSTSISLLLLGPIHLVSILHRLLTFGLLLLSFSQSFSRAALRCFGHSLALNLSVSLPPTLILISQFRSNSTSFSFLLSQSTYWTLDPLPSVTLVQLYLWWPRCALTFILRSFSIALMVYSNRSNFIYFTATICRSAVGFDFSQHYSIPLV